MTALQTRVYERAIVIGASMVGLAVARALRDHFREVVLIERDQLPREVPAHRRGVPQSWHVHNLTLRGQHELEALFPGFVDAALRLGAVRLDHARHVAAYTSYGWEPRYESGFLALSATRILLEFAERERLLATTENVRLLEGTRVLDLITAPGRDALAAKGVLTDHPEQRELRADLVVDCGGRNARWKRWFAARGLPLPRETVVDSLGGYSSRFFRPRDPAQFPWKAMLVGSAWPREAHWGVLVPLERNEWLATLGGFNGQYPPSDDAGFMTFARSLPTPLYHQALEQAEPLTPVRTFRSLEMRWHHFERYAHPLSNFLAVGDAAWAYNPLYGQGMSIGIACARILRDVLREDAALATLPSRYYARAKKFAFPPWQATALLDMRWRGTIGRRPWHAKLTLPISDLIVGAGQWDPAVNRALLDGTHLLKQPHELITPSLLLRVARYGLRRVTRKPAPRLELKMAQ